MRENGFSLVELLGVLVILAVIVLVAFPSILGALRKTDEQIDEATRAVLIANTKSYVTDTNPTANGCIMVRDLIHNGYTTSPISSTTKELSSKIETTWGVSYQYDSKTGEYKNFQIEESGC